MSHVFIDRKLNPKGKSLSNRRRFLDRIKEKVVDSNTKDSFSGDGDMKIKIAKKRISEPRYTYDKNTGIWEGILPGNKDFVPGDTIQKPKSGNQGNGNEAGQGESEDDFRFTLSREEYMNIIMEDLDLPDMTKKSKEKNEKSNSKIRAGYTTVGQESNLNVVRTLISSIGRRISLKESTINEIENLKNQFEEENDPEICNDLFDKIRELQTKPRGGFIENVDLRYNNFASVPRPKTKAVMFCVMDVSGSMDEHKKNLAKRFYILLYEFLKRKHKEIEIVFISHTETAKEVSEHNFFYSTESGGTLLSSSLKLVSEIIDSRYDVDETNIYIAQTTDGDNLSSDNSVFTELMMKLLKITQYFTYLEINSYPYHSETWRAISVIENTNDNLCVRKMNKTDELITTFRSMFKKKDS